MDEDEKKALETELAALRAELERMRLRDATSGPEVEVLRAAVADLHRDVEQLRQENKDLRDELQRVVRWLRGGVENSPDYRLNALVN